ncbi:hypothetical protein [Qipengyuania qiaonensis]|uniref:Uncharacterized protein n=1 Tax=Qipengyuania qiaonensis TaxID=2867240 RepID=A0ABS7J9Q5_9SPHN|nr:hypothetical protein [Qipengyuania qiaonensis]MBX7484037.1 hypothetical protein [Qipengyuania qiaonensis]
MTQGKTVIIMLVVLLIGFGAGFVLRPVIAPPGASSVASSVPAAQSLEARGIQYFEANVEEARHVVEGCRSGSVRGAECAKAEEAIIRVEADERRQRFLGQ